MPERIKRLRARLPHPRRPSRLQAIRYGFSGAGLAVYVLTSLGVVPPNPFLSPPLLKGLGVATALLGFIIGTGSHRVLRSIAGATASAAFLAALLFLSTFTYVFAEELVGDGPGAAFQVLLRLSLYIASIGAAASTAAYIYGLRRGGRAAARLLHMIRLRRLRVCYEKLFSMNSGAEPLVAGNLLGAGLLAMLGYAIVYSFLAALAGALYVGLLLLGLLYTGIRGSVEPSEAMGIVRLAVEERHGFAILVLSVLGTGVSVAVTVIYLSGVAGALLSRGAEPVTLIYVAAALLSIVFPSIYSAASLIQVALAGGTRLGKTCFSQALVAVSAALHVSISLYMPPGTRLAAAAAWLLFSAASAAYLVAMGGSGAEPVHRVLLSTYLYVVLVPGEAVFLIPPADAVSAYVYAAYVAMVTVLVIDGVVTRRLVARYMGDPALCRVMAITGLVRYAVASMLLFTLLVLGQVAVGAVPAIISPAAVSLLVFLMGLRAAWSDRRICLMGAYMVPECFAA